jgi:glycosyltransferase involved in cell wall biosynthesis
MYFPKISVIVAVLNGSGTLSRCIKSINSQSYLNKELIIMDGGSTDDTLKIIRDNSHQIAYWESKPDRGIYHSWNKALSHATGDWVCFLGSDDFFWRDDVLGAMIPSLETAEQRGVRLVYGRIASVDRVGGVRGFLGEPWEGTRSLLSHHMPPHPGLLHHMDVFKEHGGFDESFRIAGDYELLLRELKTRNAIFVPEIIIVGMQCGGVSCNFRNLLRLIAEDIAARKKHGLNCITTLY